MLKHHIQGGIKNEPLVSKTNVTKYLGVLKMRLEYANK